MHQTEPVSVGPWRTAKQAAAYSSLVPACGAEAASGTASLKFWFERT